MLDIINNIEVLEKTSTGKCIQHITINLIWTMYSYGNYKFVFNKTLLN